MTETAAGTLAPLDLSHDPRLEPLFELNERLSALVGSWVSHPPGDEPPDRCSVDGAVCPWKGVQDARSHYRALPPWIRRGRSGTAENSSRAFHRRAVHQ